ncbi:homeobox protein 5-like [Rhagoletis pomonella]|uniref:homeobox protein 5-like n=1 Tax=Rhagoletis pomonella TaxID=28610 RepID=UPI00177E7C67|nr:homeobox protein 5-like [Rhagoletis pomonella]
MHRKSIEAQQTLRDDSGVSDHEDSAGSKSNDESRRLTSSTESLNVVSPAPTRERQQTSSSATTPTATTASSSSPHIDLSSPSPPTTHARQLSPLQQHQRSFYQQQVAALTPPTAQPCYHPLLDAANASAGAATSKDFHMIMNTAVAAAAAAAAASGAGGSGGSGGGGGGVGAAAAGAAMGAASGLHHHAHAAGAVGPYATLEHDPDTFRNNSIACLRAKAQEHQARLLNSGLFLQVRSFAGFQASNNVAAAAASVAASNRSNNMLTNSNNNHNSNETIKIVDDSDGQCSPIDFGSICNANNSNNSGNKNNNSNMDFCLPMATAMHQQQQHQLKLERMSCDL